MRHVKLRERLDSNGFFILIVGIVQDLPCIVDNRDILRGQSLDAVRRKVDNPLDLLLRQLRVRLQAQHNRSRRRLLLFLIEAVLWQHNVDACLLNRLQLLNRTRQFPLKCLQIVDAVLEFGDSKLAVIEDLEALVPARQPLRREVQTRLVDVRRRNEDRRT